jgi:hypothetical protein
VQATASDLPRTPWSARTGREVAVRPALEIYEVETLLDVVVVTSLTGDLLHGTRRMVWNGVPQAIAWGRLPADHAEVTVHFSRGLLGRSRAAIARTGYPADVVAITDRFWIAEAEGRFDTVTVSHHGMREQRSIVSARPW